GVSVARVREGRPEAGGGGLVPPQLHQMTELLPPIITRTAVTLGINDLVAGGVSTAGAIAADLGIATDRAHAVLTAMCALGLLTREEQDYRYPPATAVLTPDGAPHGLDLS